MNRTTLLTVIGVMLAVIAGVVAWFVHYLAPVSFEPHAAHPSDGVQVGPASSDHNNSQPEEHSSTKPCQGERERLPEGDLADRQAVSDREVSPSPAETVTADVSLAERLRKLRPEGKYDEEISRANQQLEVARMERSTKVSEYIRSFLATESSAERVQAVVSALLDLWLAMASNSPLDQRRALVLLEDTSRQLEAISEIEGGVRQACEHVAPELRDKHLDVLLGAVAAHVTYSRTGLAVADHDMFLHESTNERTALGYSAAWKLDIVQPPSFVMEMVKNKDRYLRHAVEKLHAFVVAYAALDLHRPPAPFSSLSEYGVTLPRAPSGATIPEGIATVYAKCTDLIRMNLWLLYGHGLAAELETDWLKEQLQSNSWALHGYAAVSVYVPDSTNLAYARDTAASVGVWRTAYEAFRTKLYFEASQRVARKKAQTEIEYTGLVSQAFGSIVQSKWDATAVEPLDDWALLSLAAVYGCEQTKVSDAEVRLPVDIEPRLSLAIRSSERVVAVRAIEILSCFLRDASGSVAAVLDEASLSISDEVAATASLVGGSTVSRFDEIFRTRVMQMISCNDVDAVGRLVQLLNDPRFENSRLDHRRWLLEALFGLDGEWRSLAALLAGR